MVVQTIGIDLAKHVFQLHGVDAHGRVVLWIPLFEELEARGLHCCLISAQSIKRVPGRKSDVLDCQWLQTLPSSG